MARQLKMFDSEIEEPFTRENFLRIASFLRDFPLLKGEFTFKTLELENTTGAPVTYTGYQLPHGLIYSPTDIIETQVSGGSVTWRYELFTSADVFANITVNANSKFTLRCFIGRYEEGDLNG